MQSYSSTGKPQFAAWLLEQVDSGLYAGLRYVDNQSKFRVPWKHNSRKDCSEEDIQIFRGWAVASGKIITNPNNKAKWKTNFRSALNNLNKRFKMVADNSKDPDDPHKVYQIINTEYNYETQPTEEDYDMVPNIYTSLTPTDYPPTYPENFDLLNDMITLNLNGQHPEEQPWVEPYPEVPVCYQPIQALPAEPLPVPPNPQALALEQQPYNPVNPGELQPSNQPAIHDLEISIHYRRREMLKTQVSCSRLQLHYQCEDPKLQAHMLCFPDTASLLDRKQVDYTNHILHSIQKGLLLQVNHDGIYGYRQDQCRVFASTGDPREVHPDPHTLPKNRMVLLLSFEKYLADLKAFKENGASSPDYTIQMCFGEKFPDGKPLERKLVVVKVVPLICRYFHELAQQEGASSIQNDSVSLQISYNSLFDFISSALGLPYVAEGPQCGVDAF
ncbi:interferon regulatory factor 7 isoform X1 [Hypomesus transpacificus]|uniref:interferon regulatory factor 7 isoform X1 n=1 Tax=Hypomesus transpacificus TaxID=137520 RepID=UPI001F074F97|nr:interferon regulatory factor 7 isoform X1 [Hypomesus transpacificus]